MCGVLLSSWDLLNINVIDVNVVASTNNSAPAAVSCSWDKQFVPRCHGITSKCFVVSLTVSEMVGADNC